MAIEKKIIEPAPGIRLIITPFSWDKKAPPMVNIEIDEEGDPIRRSVNLDRDEVKELISALINMYI